MTGARNIPVPVPLAWSNGKQTPLSGQPITPSRATTIDDSVRRSSSHTGRRGLQAIAQSLSDRDMGVLHVVAAHRYLTTRQIEGFIFHHHATPLTGARVCRRVLRRLSSLNLLTPLQRRIGGVRAGSSSFVWQIGPLGDRLLKQRAPDAVRTRRHEPGVLFLDHCLAVADAHLLIVQAHRARELELVDVQLEPDCWRPFTGLGGARCVLQPDLYVVTGDQDPSFVNCWFIEIDLGSEHPKRLLKKCARYETYRASGIEQAKSGSFPLVVWVMKGETQTERLRQAIDRDHSLDARLFRVTTARDLLALMRRGAP